MLMSCYYAECLTYSKDPIIASCILRKEVSCYRPTVISYYALIYFMRK